MKNRVLSIKLTLTIIQVLVLNLVFLFYLKYSNNKLSFSDFDLINTGNILNIIFFSATVIGLLVSYYKKISMPSTIIFILLVLLNLFLVSVLIINFINLPRQEYYLSTLAFTQVVVISAFCLFQFTQFFLMLFVWSKILGLENLIYLRSAINSIFIAVGLLVLTLIFINTKNPSYQNQSSGSNKVKIAVVLGAAVWSDNRPSPSLASRADKAAELYTKGAINKIQLTGGNAPGELSEAEVSFKYILKKGVDRNDIWIEKETTSTIEQIRFVKNELIGEKGLNSVMIISDIYHIRRVKEICRFYDIKADVAAANLNLKTDKIIFYQLRECLALLFFWLFAL